jgi:hypothetical protein
MKVHAGDWVEVRSKEEILGTLDTNGCLDALPLMPQMLSYCGRRFKVLSSAYKTCDTVSGHYAGRTVANGVHLDIRCDGAAHGGCQAGCLLFWKEAWLKSVGQSAVAQPERDSGKCTEADVWRATSYKDNAGETRYVCQATQLLKYSKPLKWWDARQYVEAYTSGNRSFPEILRGLWFLFYYYASLAFSDFWGRPARWLYNRVQGWLGGTPFPRMKGKIAPGSSTPVDDLGLRPGDFVRVKSYEQILATLDTRLSNRGLWFDAELVPYCGRVFRVSTQVQRFVDEKTGKMRRLKTPAVILENVTCRALYSGQRMFCPRSIHLWWREIWLERAEASRPALVQAGASPIPAPVYPALLAAGKYDPPVPAGSRQLAD